MAPPKIEVIRLKAPRAILPTAARGNDRSHRVLKNVSTNATFGRVTNNKRNATEERDQDETEPIHKPKTTTYSVNAMFNRAKALEKSEYRSAEGHCSPSIPTKRSAQQQPLPITDDAGFFKKLAAVPNPLLAVQVAEPNYFIKHAKPQQQQSQTDLPGHNTGGVFSKYFDSRDASFQERKAQWQRELALRKQGLLGSGAPMDPPIPTTEDIEALCRRQKEILKPIEDEIMLVEMVSSKGPHSVRLGDTIDECARLVNRNRAKIAKTESELVKIEREIEQLQKEVFEGDDVEGDEESQMLMAALNKEVEQIEQQAEAEKDKLKKDEKAATREFNRKIEDLYKAIE